jgi:hypothetical protein
MVGEWAGIPVPIEGERLIVAPQMPFAALFDKPEQPNPEDRGLAGPQQLVVRRWRAVIHMIERPDGKVVSRWEPSFHHITHDLRRSGPRSRGGSNRNSGPCSCSAR